MESITLLKYKQPEKAQKESMLWTRTLISRIVRNC